MGPDPIARLAGEDRLLRCGSEVVVHFSRQGFAYRATGRIVRLEAHRVTVRLTVQPPLNGSGPMPRTVTVPRFADQTRWSSSHCVRPVSRGNGVSRPRP